MHPVKEKLNALLAEAKGTRWDVFASRVCGWLAILVGLAPYAHLIPGPAGALAAGTLGFIAQFLPRAQKAAGLWTVAAGQQTPFLKVLPELIKTLITAPQITADAKAQADAQAQAENAAQNEAKLRAMVDAMETRLKADVKSGVFVAGSGPGNLSTDVPAALKPIAEPAPITQEPVIEEPLIAGGATSEVAAPEEKG